MRKTLKTIAALAVASSALIGGHASAVTELKCALQGANPPSSCSTGVATVKAGKPYAVLFAIQSVGTSAASATFALKNIDLPLTIVTKSLSVKNDYKAWSAAYTNYDSVPMRYRGYVSKYNRPSGDINGYAKVSVYY